MVIPDTIRIGGIDIAVTVDKLKKKCGQYRPAESKIIINKSLSKQMKLHTFIHECIEAINYSYDIELKHHQINLLETSVTELIGELCKK